MGKKNKQTGMVNLLTKTTKLSRGREVSVSEPNEGGLYIDFKSDDGVITKIKLNEEASEVLAHLILDILRIWES